MIQSRRRILSQLGDHERLVLAFQALVAFAIVSAPLLYPLEATIAVAGLVRVILIEASVHPRLAGGLARIF